MPMDRWDMLPRKKLQRNVFKVQKRIYQASQRDDVKTVRQFQRLLMNSRSAKLLAVRKVTQENQGKRTAGVDGVKALTPPQRLKLANTLKIDHKAKPVRRVWIPKPDTDEQRPLGIPTVHDRALQTLVKLALEPEWEPSLNQTVMDSDRGGPVMMPSRQSSTPSPIWRNSFWMPISRNASTG